MSENLTIPITEMINRICDAEALLLKARLIFGYVDKYDAENILTKDGSARAFVEECFEHLSKYDEPSEYSAESEK